MRAWVVASGIVESPDGILLVQNQRRDRDGLDWSPPGGVVEVADGESVLDGLTREVEEETGVRVAEWAGPVWEVEAEAVGMGWTLKVEVYRAVSYSGDVLCADPDEIVVGAEFVACDAVESVAAGSMWLPTREPLLAWLTERWTESRSFRYRVDGDTRETMSIARL